MQYLIGVILVMLGAFFGFGLCSMLTYGKAQDIAEAYLHKILLSLKSGEIKIEDIKIYNLKGGNHV
jgi:hypothetical protein